MEKKEIFYTNLLLLGFDTEAQEAKFRIPFNSDMFLYPNKKAMEVVLHFLFCTLDAPLAFQEFRDCWPVQDKKMEQQFRKSCNSWLVKISKEELDSNLPRIGPSLFLSPGGDKFYEVMFYFSLYVLRKVMIRDHCHGKESAVPHICKKSRMPRMNSISCKAMLVRMLAAKNRFFENVQCDLEVQEDWKSHAMSSTKEYRKLCKENRELEKKLNPTGENIYLKERTNYVEETEALRRTKQLQEVREHWSTLESFWEKTREKRTILNEILENNEAKFNLDGSSIQLQVPDVLTTKYRHAIQRKNIKNTYEEGKLNMLSLVQLSNLSLHELKEKIRQVGIPDFEQSVAYVEHEVRTHGTHLAQAQNLRASLENDLIPELKKSIDKLKEECYAFLDETVHSPVISLDSFEFGLGLLPKTPAPEFSSSGHLTHSASGMPEISLRKTPRNDATPDVIENLTTSVREMVIEGNQQPDDIQFPSTKEISTRTFNTAEIPRRFVSKIPKPVRHRLGQTPDVTSVRRRSLTTAKKPKRPTGSGVRMEGIDRRKEFASPRVAGLKDASKRKVKAGEKLDVTTAHTIDQFTTPLATGTKSCLTKPCSSARNILAEKIAAVVFSDEPSTQKGSSPSSSAETTPKDLAIADPLANLTEEPFTSKDLIPRTPFKRDVYFSDASDDDVPNSGIKSISESMISPPDKKTPRKDEIFHMETPLLRTGPVSTDSRINTEPLICNQYSQPNTSVAGMGTIANQQSPLVSDIAPMSSSTGGHDRTTINPVLLRYQQWKKAQEVTVRSGTVVSTAGPTTDVAINSLTADLLSDNLLSDTQSENSQNDITRQIQRSTDTIISRTNHTPEVMSDDLLPGNQVESRVTNLSEQPHLFKLDMSTPLMTGHRELPRDTKPQLTFVTEDDIRNADSSSVTRSRYQPTHVTYTKDFATPMMSSIGKHFYEFGQTPLENIAPPIDFNSNPLYSERRDSVRSRLSFDLDTPGPSMQTKHASGQQHYLNTPSAKDIADVKLDDVLKHREFDLIPVNTDDLFQDDGQLTFGKDVWEYKKDVTEQENIKDNESRHVKVGQLIEFD